MMTDMMAWMAGGAGLVWILVVVILLLGAAALVKYVRKEPSPARRCIPEEARNFRLLGQGVDLPVTGTFIVRPGQ